MAEDGLKLETEIGRLLSEGSEWQPLSCRAGHTCADCLFCATMWVATFLCHLEMLHCDRGWSKARNRNWKALPEGSVQDPLSCRAGLTCADCQLCLKSIIL